MTFEEAKKQVLADEAARMAEWHSESLKNIAEGTPSMLDIICTRQHNLWERIYFPTRRAIRDFFHGYTWRWAKTRYGRARYGYGQDDLWNIDTYLAEMMMKMLRELKEKHFTVPMEIKMPGGYSVYLEDDASDESWESYKRRWEDALERMAQGFEAHMLLAEVGWVHNTEAEKALVEYRKEGLRMLVDNFPSLWD